MLNFIKKQFIGVKSVETKIEDQSKVIFPLSQKLIDIRDDIYSIVFLKLFIKKNFFQILSRISKIRNLIIP